MVLTDGDCVARIVPERGALVSHFAVGGEELLFLDESTLTDPGKNVRGGIPVLFPSPGVVPGGTYRVEGRDHPMRRHGFARDLAWEVRARDNARAELVLGNSPQTQREFPWRFEARLTVSVSNRALRLAFAVENQDIQPLPLHLGYHPYFFVPQANKAVTRIDTDATRAWNNRTGEPMTFEGVDLTATEVDMHLLDHSRPGTTLHRGPGLRPVELSWSPSFTTVVVWTLTGRDFVCVEPWTAPAGALRTGQGLLPVEPGATFSSEFEIRAGALAP
ncbi:MAG: aldose epimerase [Cystobacter sp.]